MSAALPFDEGAGLLARLRAHRRDTLEDEQAKARRTHRLDKRDEYSKRTLFGLEEILRRRKVAPALAHFTLTAFSLLPPGSREMSESLEVLGQAAIGGAPAPTSPGETARERAQGKRAGHVDRKAYDYAKNRSRELRNLARGGWTPIRVTPGSQRRERLTGKVLEYHETTWDLSPLLDEWGDVRERASRDSRWNGPAWRTAIVEAAEDLYAAQARPKPAGKRPPERPGRLLRNVAGHVATVKASCDFYPAEDAGEYRERAHRIIDEIFDLPKGDALTPERLAELLEMALGDLAYTRGVDAAATNPPERKALGGARGVSSTPQDGSTPRLLALVGGREGEHTGPDREGDSGPSEGMKNTPRISSAGPDAEEAMAEPDPYDEVLASADEEFGVTPTQSTRPRVDFPRATASEQFERWRALLGAQRSGSEYIATCPVHGDEHASLSLTLKGGAFLVYCRSHQCAFEDIKAAIEAPGFSPAPVKRKTSAKKGTRDGGRRDVVARFTYADEHGVVLYRVNRTDPKGFYQERREAGRWIGGPGAMKGVRLVPYRLPELLAAPVDAPVFVVEGEKHVDMLASLGLAATCNVMGAGKWRSEYSEHLRGRVVVVLPDNDDAGRAHADLVAKSLRGIAASVSVVALEGLGPKGDVVDWLAAGHTASELLTLAPVVAVQESAAPAPRELVVVPDDAYVDPPRCFDCGATSAERCVCDTPLPF